MNSNTLDQVTDVLVHRRWRSDPEVSACFRALYRRLQSGSEEPVRAVGITSCRRGEGVSTVASRLAIAAAEEGEQKVLLVDANPAAPSVHRAFKIDPTPGFLNAVQGSHPLEQLLQPTAVENLWVLPVGTTLPWSPAVESRTSVPELFSGLSPEFSFVVVDMAPVDQLGDLFGLMTAVDGIVLVVEAECTNRNLAREAVHALSQSRLLGAVLNKRQETR